MALAACALAGCGASPRIVVLTGPIDRARIEAEVPNWRDELAHAEIDGAAARALAEVPPGAEVDVFLGTWCGDSRRVVSRLFRALEEVPEERRPFAIRFIAVDREKRDPDGLSDGRDIRFVPTIIVTREGTEIGRIVESAPSGVEVDLGRLLRGEATGTLTLRTDLR
jgi:thiol-disulfide isomerase/thioredoxin